MLIPSRAASHSFQVSQTDDVESLVISNTTLEAYHCVEKRDGLTAIARRLLSGTSLVLFLVWAH